MLLALIFALTGRCFARLLQLSCDNKMSESCYPVVQTGCRFYYCCRATRDMTLIPRAYQCPGGYLFDFTMQTCVLPTKTGSSCKDPGSQSCNSKCDCKVCHCHNDLCGLDCDTYKDKWCRYRRSRSLPVEATKINSNSTFDCSDKMPGAYYSDPVEHCKIYHVCFQPLFSGTVIRRSYQCPSGTAFHQKLLSCEPIDSFACETVGQFYLLRSSIRDKPSIPAKFVGQTAIATKINPFFAITKVVTQHPPTSTLAPTTMMPLSESDMDISWDESEEHSSDCPKYKCCPDLCPPCHEVCPSRSCIANWCKNYVTSSSHDEDVQGYFSPAKYDLPSSLAQSEHIFYFDGNETPLSSGEGETNNYCLGKFHGGIFANVADGCESFYYCVIDNDRGKLKTVSYVCPSGTFFNQKTAQCDWSMDYPCDESHLYF